MSHNVKFVRARSALSDAAANAHLCYWVGEGHPDHQYHLGTLHTALKQAAAHLGYALVPVQPVITEGIETIFMDDKMND